MKAKLTDSHEIKKCLTIKDFWLNKTGLELLYDFKGVEYYKEFNPWQTAHLLRRADLIDEYWQSSPGLRRGPKEIQIAFSYARGHEDETIETLPFEEFVAETRFSQYDALCIAVLCVWDEELKAAKEEAKSKIVL
jgi:hypothetical protein